VAIVLTPSVWADHAGKPEERTRPSDERGADDRPLGASGHERPGDDADALEEEDRSREEGDDGDDPDGEPHGYVASGM